MLASAHINKVGGGVSEKGASGKRKSGGPFESFWFVAPKENLLRKYQALSRTCKEKLSMQYPRKIESLQNRTHMCSG